MHAIDGPLRKHRRFVNLLLLPLLVLVVLGLASGRARASAFQLAEQSASGLGNDYAGSAAIAEDASTIFFNPAGMTRLPGVNVSAGGTAISTTFRFANAGSVGPGGAPLGSNTGGNAGSTSIVPNAYLSWQLGPRWFAGLGVSSPFGLATQYDDGWLGRYQATKFSIQTVNVNPSVAYRVTDRLSVGAGLNWQYLDADYQRAVPTVLRSDATADAKLRGDAWGWNLGVLYQLTDTTRLGVSYRSALHYDSTGTTTLRDVPGPLRGRVPSGVDSSASFTLPDTATFSVVHDLSPKWQLLGDLAWTGWRRLPSFTVDNGVLGQDRLQLDFRDTWRLALGVNYRYAPRLTFKAGVGYDQSPVPGDDVRPVSLPDSNRVSVSVGAQYRLGPRATVDVGYAHLFFHPSINNGGDPQKGSVRGDWQAGADLFGLQVSYRF